MCYEDAAFRTALGPGFVKVPTQGLEGTYRRQEIPVFGCCKHGVEACFEMFLDLINSVYFFSLYKRYPGYWF
jgi:hypothetical protein